MNFTNEEIGILHYILKKYSVDHINMPDSYNDLLYRIRDENKFRLSDKTENQKMNEELISSQLDKKWIRIHSLEEINLIFQREFARHNQVFKEINDRLEIVELRLAAIENTQYSRLQKD